jgi:hypothetical protein
LKTEISNSLNKFELCLIQKWSLILSFKINIQNLKLQNPSPTTLGRNSLPQPISSLFLLKKRKPKPFSFLGPNQVGPSYIYLSPRATALLLLGLRPKTAQRQSQPAQPTASPLSRSRWFHTLGLGCTWSTIRVAQKNMEHSKITSTPCIVLKKIQLSHFEESNSLNFN